MKYFLVKEDVMLKLLDYLTSKPYIEVHEGVSELLKCNTTEILSENKGEK